MTEYSDERFSLKLLDGIIYMDWKLENADYNFVNDAIKYRLMITNGKSYPLLSDITKLKNGTKEARERLADKDGQANLSALAVIYDSKFQGLLMTLFNLIYKHSIPTKYFSSNSKIQAIEWLQQYK